MIPLAHRGLWTIQEDQNSLAALVSAASKGLGIETDLRDLNGELVISHDPPTGEPLTLIQLLEALQGFNMELLLNVKSDGLQTLATSQTAGTTTDVKFFDMSVPDLMHYRKSGLRYLYRLSEFEPPLNLGGNCEGVWIDDFSGDWLTPEKLIEISSLGISSYVVSAELHGHEREKQWTLLKNTWGHKDFRLCTDYPLEAIEFFK